MHYFVMIHAFMDGDIWKSYESPNSQYHTVVQKKTQKSVWKNNFSFGIIWGEDAIDHYTQQVELKTFLVGTGGKNGEGEGKAPPLETMGFALVFQVA